MCQLKHKHPITVILIFPPQHDPSFAHSALPYLSGYLKKYAKNCTIELSDLNLNFYQDEVFNGNSTKFLSVNRRLFDEAESLEKALSIAQNFECELRNHLKVWSENNDGYEMTLRSFSSPYDRNDCEAIRRFSDSKTPFDKFYSDFLDSCNANVFGITISVEDQVLPAFKLMSMIRLYKPDSKIVLGGAYTTRVSPLIKAKFHDYFDYLVEREGEEAMLEIINYENGMIDQLHNDRITISSSLLKKMIEDPIDRPQISMPNSSVQELTDERIPSFEGLPVHEYFGLSPMLPILTSRKCYWGKCKFCTIHESWDPKVRIRQADSVYEELKFVSEKYNIRKFRFVDEAIPPNLISNVADLLIDGALDIEYEIYAIAEKRFTRNGFVPKLGQSGCRQIYFGLESANKEALRVMGKQINYLDGMPTIFSECEENKIHVYVFSLFGYPGIPEQADRETIEFISENTSIHTATIASFVPVVGSPFANEYADKLTHLGNFSEDYFSLKSSDGNITLAQDLGKNSAVSAMEKIFSSRPDLQLNSFLNDETRFILSCGFGANYASKIKNLGVVVANQSLLDNVRERISRDSVTIN